MSNENRERVKAYRVCSNCNRIIGEFTMFKDLVPFGVSSEFPHNCPMCKKKR